MITVGDPNGYGQPIRRMCIDSRYYYTWSIVGDVDEH